MSRDINITVEHVTRVEGHGNIVLNVKEGTIEKIEWQVSEAPRFFEAFVRGQSYDKLSHLTSRICGICSIGPSITNLESTEAAMGVSISRQTLLLRKLALHGENMQSHVLHVGYLVAPDLLGADSVVPLAKSHTDAVVKIVTLHRLANEMSDLICGRTIHPITLKVGGFTKIPTVKELLTLKQRILDSVPTAVEVGDLVLSLAGALPAFTRETEYIGLTGDDEYHMYDGILASTDAGRLDLLNYENIVNEYVVPQSTAKHAKHKRGSFMVGALARVNLNYDKLHPEAKKVAEKFGLKPITCNPYFNTVAQLVEVFHSMYDTVDIIDTLIAEGLKDEDVKITVKAGRGISAVEVPRGILIHDYTIDENGICTKANCVIPTNMNHGNIQKDMEAIVPTLLDKPEKEIELTLEMLVRAYDPCISCPTHCLDVKFV